MNRNDILLIPEKSDPETESIAKCWKDRRGKIIRLGKYWIKDDTLLKENISVYGNQTFCLILAQLYHLRLISPEDDLISNIDPVWIKRKIRVINYHELNPVNFPLFIKPLTPKLFAAGIYNSLKEFSDKNPGLREEKLIVSEIIEDIEYECRAFVLNNEVKDISIYEGNGELKSARDFLVKFINTYKHFLPKTCVIDLGYSNQKDWFILEFNATWGAGLNGCKAENILDCIRAASSRIENL